MRVSGTDGLNIFFNFKFRTLLRGMVEPLPSWESSDDDDEETGKSRTPISYISYHSYVSGPLFYDSRDLCRDTKSFDSDWSELSVKEPETGKFLNIIDCTSIYY